MLLTLALAAVAATAAHADPARHAVNPDAAAHAEPDARANPAPYPDPDGHGDLDAHPSLVGDALARPAPAGEPRGPLRLTSAPCTDENGAALRCIETTARLPRPLSYFEQHERLVMRDMLRFNHSYTLEYLRERDALQLYGPPAGGASAVAESLAIFGTTIIGAAHLPGRARVIFDHRVHLGPALFDGGGMGAGIGARL